MPQMAPLMWAFLYMIILMIMLMIMTKLYFVQNNKMHQDHYSSLDDKKNFYWKW